MKTLNRGLRLNDFARETIDEIDRCKKSFVPKLERHGSIRKKRETNLDNMSMFTLSGAILLMCMRTRNKVSDANALEKRIEFLILTTPIGLHGNNFLIKETFNKMLKIMKLLKNIRFIFQQIDSCELTEIINKTDIVFISPNRIRGWTPNIRKYKFKWR
jgi:hypothetical protein